MRLCSAGRGPAVGAAPGGWLDPGPGQASVGGCSKQQFSLSVARGWGRHERCQGAHSAGGD